VKQHGKTLDAIPRLGADAILKHMTPLQGITDSYTFTKAVMKKVSSKYTGEFKGLRNIGEFVPRTLTVRPIVMEILDEPERYRRSYVTEVRGAIEIAKHPFEMWLVQEILKQGSNDLLMALATAKYNSSDSATDITDAFDSIPAIVEAEKTAIILSEHYPQYVWLAAGGLYELHTDKFKPLRGRRIVLFPDTDPDGKAYRYWYQTAQEVMDSPFWEGSPPIRVSTIPLVEGDNLHGSFGLFPRVTEIISIRRKELSP
jgi:hypothetical protein